jgi:hypothetical protein
MTNISRCSGLSVTALIVAAALAPAEPVNALAPRPADSALCNAPTTRSVAQHYAVTGRIKLLLIRTGRRDVGAARFVRGEEGERARRLELLVGTDPDRRPEATQSLLKDPTP